MSNKALPCPFCGNPMHPIPTEQPAGWCVGGLHKHWCPLGMLTHNRVSTYVSREDAVMAWNMRTTQQQGQSEAEPHDGIAYPAITSTLFDATNSYLNGEER